MGVVKMLHLAKNEACQSHDMAISTDYNKEGTRRQHYTAPSSCLRSFGDAYASLLSTLGHDKITSSFSRRRDENVLR